MDLPPLSCGGIYGAAAIAVEESDSAAEQVLLLGGADEDGDGYLLTVQLVDLATGVCDCAAGQPPPPVLPSIGGAASGRAYRLRGR